MPEQLRRALSLQLPPHLPCRCPSRCPSTCLRTCPRSATPPLAGLAVALAVAVAAHEPLMSASHVPLHSPEHAAAALISQLARALRRAGALRACRPRTGTSRQPGLTVASQMRARSRRTRRCSSAARAARSMSSAMLRVGAELRLHVAHDFAAALQASWPFLYVSASPRSFASAAARGREVGVDLVGERLHLDRRADARLDLGGHLGACSLKFAAKSNLSIASSLVMSGQLPTAGRARPGIFGSEPQLTMNGAASPAKTIGHETRRQNLRVIVVLPPEDLVRPATRTTPSPLRRTYRPVRSSAGIPRPSPRNPGTFFPDCRCACAPARVRAAA